MKSSDKPRVTAHAMAILTECNEWHTAVLDGVPVVFCPVAPLWDAVAQMAATLQDHVQDHDHVSGHRDTSGHETAE